MSNYIYTYIFYKKKKKKKVVGGIAPQCQNLPPSMVPGYRQYFFPERLQYPRYHSHKSTMSLRKSNTYDHPFHSYKPFFVLKAVFHLLLKGSLPFITCHTWMVVGLEDH